MAGLKWEHFLALVNVPETNFVNLTKVYSTRDTSYSKCNKMPQIDKGTFLNKCYYAAEVNNGNAYCYGKWQGPWKGRQFVCANVTGKHSL